MTKFRMLPVALLAVAATARSQEPATDVSPTPHGLERAGRVDAERERVRSEFVRAREEYADLLVSALTSEELARHVRDLSADVRRRLSEKDRGELRSVLGAAQSPGRPDESLAPADRAPEAGRGLGPEPAGGPPPTGWGEATPVRDVIVARFEREMADETTRLADALATRELAERAKRLRRVVLLARVGVRLGGLQLDRAPVDDRGGSEVGPADAAPGTPGGSLGEGTTVPPDSLFEAGPAGQGGAAGAKDSAPRPQTDGELWQEPARSRP